MRAEDDSLFAIDDPIPHWVSVAALQCRLRDLFATMPLHRAAAEAMQHIGVLLDAEYAVVHARFGPQILSEEWSRPEFDLSDSLREQVSQAMMEATEADEARCVRLGGADGQSAVIAAVLYGEGAEQAGSAGFVFADCDRAHAYEMLVQVEALIGLTALLMSERSRRPSDVGPGHASAAHAGDPTRLLLHLVTEIGSRHPLDQVSVGVVDGQNVRVALINNETDLQPGNPGVRAIREAMAECLDKRAPIIVGPETTGSQHLLHAAWLHQRGSGAVATLPLEIDGKIVAIVAVAAADAQALRPERVGAITRDMRSYAELLPIARLAVRSLWRHLRDEAAGQWQKFRERRRRILLPALLGLAAVFGLFFGTLPYRLTVPATVRALDRCVVSCPREGVLADLFVRPGDQVQAGQLLAELDSHDDMLMKAELQARLMTIDARIDKALGDQDSGALRVLEAEREGILSQTAVVARRIEQARIRSPRDGVVLAGELREKLGARLGMGDTMFELARYDGTQVEMRIPEQVVLDARAVHEAVFVAVAAPEVEHALTQLRLAPASRVLDGKNVFIAEADADDSMARLPPGMEGFAVLDAGRRPVWWLLSHRILDWLQLNFWV